MPLSEQDLKQAVLRALDELPGEKMAEVLDFALFLRTRWQQESARTGAVQPPPSSILRTMPAAHLDGLTGLIAWGGDAVADAERLYEDHS